MASCSSTPAKLPASMRSADGAWRVTFARLKDGSGYYVSFYSLDKYGAPRFSTSSPSGVLSKARAYAAGLDWVGRTPAKKNPRGFKSYHVCFAAGTPEERKRVRHIVNRWGGRVTKTHTNSMDAAFQVSKDADEAIKLARNIYGLGAAIFLPARKNPALGAYFRAGARAAAESAAALAPYAKAAIASATQYASGVVEDARQRATAEATKRVADKPTVEQALQVLAEAHGVKLNPRPARRKARRPKARRPKTRRSKRSV